MSQKIKCRLYCGQLLPEAILPEENQTNQEEDEYEKTTQIVDYETVRIVKCPSCG